MTVREEDLRAVFSDLDVLGEGKLTMQSLQVWLPRPGLALSELGSLGYLDLDGFRQLLTPGPTSESYVIRARPTNYVALL